MAIDFFPLLSKFQPFENIETEQAYFLTKTPEVAPLAYLHIIYKHTKAQVIAEISKNLELPASVVDFYQSWNGALLFNYGLAILGCVEPGTQLDRTAPFDLPPFNIMNSNVEFRRMTKSQDLIVIGSYRYDGSIVCIERRTERVVCFEGRGVDKIRAKWPSLEHWLVSEIDRISFYFDERGHRLVDKERLLPDVSPLIC